MKKQGAPIEESPQIQPSAGNGTEQYPLANSLDNEKMRLEIKKLQTELRTGSLTFEIIKAVGTFATVAGITLTLSLAFELSVKPSYPGMMSDSIKPFPD